jgi:hypothetical protein
MTPNDKTAVVVELRRLGFGEARAGAGRRPAASRADLRFIHVMWRLLGEAGALKKPGRAGLNSFIRSRFEAKWGAIPVDIDVMREPGQINDVMRALKDWCGRAGVELK